MASVETINIKASSLGKGDVIMDGSTMRLIEDYDIKKFATSRVFHTVVVKRIFGINVKMSRKKITAHADDIFTIWHTMILDGSDIMRGDKVYHKGEIAMVKRIKPFNAKKLTLFTTAGRFNVANTEILYVAV